MSACRILDLCLAPCSTRSVNACAAQGNGLMLSGRLVGDRHTWMRPCTAQSDEGLAHFLNTRQKLRRYNDSLLNIHFVAWPRTF